MLAVWYEPILELSHGKHWEISGCWWISGIILAVMLACVVLVRYAGSLRWFATLVRYAGSLRWFATLVRYAGSLRWFATLECGAGLY